MYAKLTHLCSLHIKPAVPLDTFCSNLKKSLMLFADGTKARTRLKKRSNNQERRDTHLVYNLVYTWDQPGHSYEGCGLIFLG